MSLRLSARLGLLQALAYAGIGAVFPYLALDLRGRGVAGVALVAALVAAPTLRLALGPAWGLATDRLGQTRAPVLLAGALVLIGLATLAPDWGAAAAVGAVWLVATGTSGLSPLVDAATLRAVDHDPSRYGAIRKWGSVGFLLAVFAAGALRDAWGVPPVLLGVVLTATFVLVAAGLPAGAAPDRPPSPLALLRALRAPAPLLLLAAAACHFAGIALYDGFFSVHLDALGHGTTWAGVAVALGVGVEVGVFAVAGPMVRRVGPPALLLTALGLNLPRWLLTAWFTDPVPLVATQAVHGFTFGAFWLATVLLLDRHVPRTMTGGAQGLLAAAVGGVGAGMGNLAGGAIVQLLPTVWLFGTAAALAAAATVLAALALLADRRA